MRERLGQAKAIVPSAEGRRLRQPARRAARPHQRRLCAQPFRRDGSRHGGWPTAGRNLFVLAMACGPRIHNRMGGLDAKDIKVWDGQR
jgi:hypothetical protein